MSDTSLVFNLVARDRATETLGKVREKFDAAATGIATGVAAGLGVGVAAALDMSAANAKLAAQLGVGPAEAAELSKVSADVYAGAWGDSAETVNSAIRGVYQNIGDTSGIKGGLEGATEDVLALSEAFDVDLAMSTKTVGQLMKTGLAKDAGEAMDLVTWGMQNGLNASDDFLDTLNEYAPQFQKLGLDGKTSLGLLNTMMQAGVRDSDAAADAIKEFGLRAIDTSDAVTQAYEGIGLNADEMRTKIAAGGPGAAQAMGQVWEALKRVQDPLKQNQLGTALMGTQWEDTVRSILPNLDTTKLGIEGVAGATDKMAKTLSDSPAKSLEKFKREAMVKLAEVGGKFIQFASDNSEVFEPLAETLAGIAGTVLVIKGAMMVWTAAQTAWAAATAIATGAQWLFNTALFASPITWIVIAIVALVVAIYLIATKTTWFQTIWSTVWGAITTAFDATISWLSDAFKWFGTLPGKFASWFGTAKDWAINKMMALVRWQIGLPGRLLGALASLGSSLWRAAYGAFQSLKNAAVDRAVSLVSWVTGLPGRLVGALAGQAYRFYNMGLDFVFGLWDGISAAGGWLWSKISNFASNYIVNPVKDFLHIGSPSKLAADEIGHWIPAGIAMGVEDNSGVVDEAMRGLVSPAAYRPSAQAVSSLAPIAGANSGGAALSQNRVLFEFVGGSRAFREFFQESVRVSAGGDVVKFAKG